MGLFFYGTLQSDTILNKVLNISTSSNKNFKKWPATLKGFKRVLVKGKVYPAIFSSPDSETIGLYIEGLDELQIIKLDSFEGPEYKKISVQVEYEDEKGLSTIKEAQTYIWIADLDLLSDKEWSFNVFSKQKLKAWVLDEEEFGEST